MATSSPLQAIERVLASLRDARPLRVLGADAGFTGLLLARAADDPQARGPAFVVAPDDASARALAADVAFFLGRGAQGFVADEPDGPILIIPEIDTSPYGDASPDPRGVALRLASLYRLGQASGERPRLIIASVRSLLRRVIPPAAFRGLCDRWELHGELDREAAIAQLVRAGYQRVDVVEDPGTFAVRGAVIDVFGGLSRFPTRVELFGDELERLRLFDPDSQRSLRDVGELVIHPVRELIQTADEPLKARVLALADAIEAPTSRTRLINDNLAAGLDFFGLEALIPLFHERLAPLWEYLPEETRWYTPHPDALALLAARIEDEWLSQHARRLADKQIVAPPAAFFVDADEAAARLRGAPVVTDALDLYEPGEADDRPVLRVRLERNQALQSKLAAARGVAGGELLRPLVDRIRELSQGPDHDVDPRPWTVVLVAPNHAHAERLASLLRGYGVALAPYDPDPGPLALEAPDVGETRVQIVAGTLSEGFSDAEDRFLLVSEGELYGAMTRRARRRRGRAGLASLAQLAVGDYVVHLTHGIGRYLGLTKMTLRGIPGDYVQLEYAGKDKLYLPVYRIHEIERFAAADGKPPKLDKMGGATFLVKAKKVKESVRQMAEELLQIYAEREARRGHAFPAGGDLYAQFELTFPFEETADQGDAIDAVYKDMSDERPMDRLICGDVGFGKTEVALRAAFRAAVAGQQVAVLAPTTVLVQQHYMTFRERMERFPVRVGCLSRFESAAARKATVAGLRDGSIDVVIGTHRLLGRDVRFKRLGLLVIDEEQRFGVKQKERFKKFKAEVEVLTLTATPIPRTLHMSLLGLREISMIMTPPVDRLAVRTYITRQSEAVIEEGVRRELARGGQVFYVVPRVQGIEEHAVRLRKLVPEARVIVAHGQMPVELLEQAMVDFVEHRGDVLVSTTIIESGLDIPRANTMFIARADMFGLAQLYQLRGRVGRSRLRAHCYLMVQALERLTPDARRRLEAIQRHAELGSGFNVASQDLEIRGAGDLLGARQSGYIQAIGFEAYARILAEAVAELRGDPILREHDPEMVFDAPAYLPESYVADVGQRLDFYRRLSGARDVDEIDEVMAELIDRYGDPPLPAEHLALVMSCKTYGRKLRALALELAGTRFAVRLGPETPLSAEAAVALHRETKGRLRLAGERVVATVPAATGDDRSRQLRMCVKALAEMVART